MTFPPFKMLRKRSNEMFKATIDMSHDDIKTMIQIEKNKTHLPVFRMV